eukprot:GHVT01006051.1.p1 GENE.GHVT01006051.1~~GHVT01006051.1.p1  ORF type:complete len:893 (+),score=189.76 GHVT01006051.1:3571-6249(+)
MRQELSSMGHSSTTSGSAHAHRGALASAGSVETVGLERNTGLFASPQASTILATPAACVMFDNPTDYFAGAAAVSSASRPPASVTGKSVAIEAHSDPQAILPSTKSLQEYGKLCVFDFAVLETSPTLTDRQLGQLRGFVGSLRSLAGALRRGGGGRLELGILELDTDNCRKALADVAEKLALLLLGHIRRRAKILAQLLLAQYSSSHHALVAVPSSENDVAALRDLVATVPDVSARLGGASRRLRHFLDVLGVFEFAFSDAALTGATYRLGTWPKQLEISQQRAEAQLETSTQELRRVLDGEHDSFVAELRDHAIELEAFQLEVSSQALALKHATKIASYKEKLERAVERGAELQRRTELFGMPGQKAGEEDANKHVLQVINAFQPHLDLWTVCVDIKFAQEEWLSAPLKRLNASEINQSMSNWTAVVKKLGEHFEEQKQQLDSAAQEQEDQSPSEVPGAAISAVTGDSFEPVTPSLKHQQPPATGDGVCSESTDNYDASRDSQSFPLGKKTAAVCVYALQICQEVLGKLEEFAKTVEILRMLSLPYLLPSHRQRLFERLNAENNEVESSSLTFQQLRRLDIEAHVDFLRDLERDAKKEEDVRVKFNAVKEAAKTHFQLLLLPLKEERGDPEGTQTLHGHHADPDKRGDRALRPRAAHAQSNEINLPDTAGGRATVDSDAHYVTITNLRAVHKDLAEHYASSIQLVQAPGAAVHAKVLDDWVAQMAAAKSLLGTAIEARRQRLRALQQLAAATAAERTEGRPTLSPTSETDQAELTEEDEAGGPSCPPHTYEGASASASSPAGQHDTDRFTTLRKSRTAAQTHDRVKTMLIVALSEPPTSLKLQADFLRIRKANLHLADAFKKMAKIQNLVGHPAIESLRQTMEKCIAELHL